MKKSLVAIALALGISAIANTHNRRDTINSIISDFRTPIGGYMLNPGPSKSSPRHNQNSQTNKVIIDFRNDAYLHSVARTNIHGVVDKMMPAVAYGYRNNGVFAVDYGNGKSSPSFFFKMSPSSDTNVVYHVQGKCIFPSCRQEAHLETLATNLFDSFSNGTRISAYGILKIYRSTPDPNSPSNSFAGIFNVSEITFTNSGSSKNITIDPVSHPHKPDL